MKRNKYHRVSEVLAAALTLAATAPVWAGYQANGYDLGLVQSGTGLANTAASVQTAPLNLAATLNTTLTTNFTIQPCQTIDYARLYLDIYGGMPYHAAQLTVTGNGHSLPTLTLGGTGDRSGTGTPGDGNPSTRAPNTNCVYGSGFSYWQVALANVAPYLNTNGSANAITFSTTTTSTFDGRAYGASLAVICSDPTIQQTVG